MSRSSLSFSSQKWEARSSPSTRRRETISDNALDGANLRDALQRNDGQLLSPVAMPDAQFDDSAWSSSDERVRGQQCQFGLLTREPRVRI